jgi:hypothetical protein
MPQKSYDQIMKEINDRKQPKPSFASDVKAAVEKKVREIKGLINATPSDVAKRAASGKTGNLKTPGKAKEEAGTMGKVFTRKQKDRQTNAAESNDDN